jgi:hypothetical protein
MELVPIPSASEVRLLFLAYYISYEMRSKRRDPLHVLLDYIGTVSAAFTMFIYPTTLLKTWTDSGLQAVTWPSFTTMTW